MLLLGQGMVTGQEVANEFVARGYTIVIPPPPPPPPPVPPVEPPHVPTRVEPVIRKRPPWVVYALVAAIGYYMVVETERQKRGKRKNQKGQKSW